MHDEQPPHTSGGVPHAYRQTLFWRWAPAMPRRLRGGFLTLLYALASAANTSGSTRFKGGGAIRISDLARAAGSDEKDCRRYLDAAIAAGVLTVQGERKRGRATVYALALAPVPDWTAAVASLTASQRVRKQPPAPWQQPEEFGGPTPEPGTQPSSGDQPPNSTGMSSGDQPRNEFGGPTPIEFGGPTPEQPRGTQVLPQELAEAVQQPPDARGLTPNEFSPEQLDDEDGPHLHALPSPAVGSRARRDAGHRQSPLLASVPTDYTELRQAAESNPGLVRAAVRDLGHREALRIYGRRLVWDHARDLIDSDHRTGS